MKRLLYKAFSLFLLAQLALPNRSYAQVTSPSLNREVLTTLLSLKMQANGDSLGITPITIDEEGNIWVAGVSATGGNAVLSPAALGVSKFSPEGSLLWARTYAYLADSSVFPTDIRADSSGNVYIVGYAENVTAIPHVGITVTGQRGFILKLDSAGNELWRYFTTFSGGYSYASALNLDAATGHALVQGAFGTEPLPYTVRPDTLLWPPDSGAVFQFVASFPPGGTAPAWVYADSLSAYTYPAALATDTAGNVYTAAALRPDTTADADFYLLKLDTTGAKLWDLTYDAGTNTDDIPHALALDPQGNAYLAGYTDSLGTGHALTLAADASGALIWAHFYHGPLGLTRATHVVCRDSLVYTGGTSTGADSTFDFFVACQDTSGTLLWVNRYATPALNTNDLLRDLAVDPLGQVYLSGYSYPGPDRAADTASTLTTLAYAADGRLIGLDTYDQGPTPCWTVRSVILRGLALADTGTAYVIAALSSPDLDTLSFPLLRYTVVDAEAILHRNRETFVRNQNILARAVAGFMLDSAFQHLVRHYCDSAHFYTVRLDTLAAYTPNFLTRATAALTSSGASTNEIDSLPLIYLGYNLEGQLFMPTIAVPYYIANENTCWDGLTPTAVAGVTVLDSGVTHLNAWAGDSSGNVSAASISIGRINHLSQTTQVMMVDPRWHLQVLANTPAGTTNPYLMNLDDCQLQCWFNGQACFKNVLFMNQLNSARGDHDLFVWDIESACGISACNAGCRFKWIWNSFAPPWAQL